MADIRVDKVLVGSPTYKVQVGNVTRVEKVVVGTPISTVVIGPYADIDNIVGVDTSGKTDGAALVYDSDSGNFVANRDPIFEVDGKTYPSDSAHTNILIRRSGTQGEPVVLQQGELAYSYLVDSALDGFGNGGDRLYIATGPDSAGQSTQIDVIGGKYFTQLLNHPVGQLTANSALLADSNRSLDLILADSATFTYVRSTELFTDDITLNTSAIKANDGKLTNTTDTYTYLEWGENLDELKGFGPSTISPIISFSSTGQDNNVAFVTVDRNYTPPDGTTPFRPNGQLAAFTVPNLLEVTGFTELDSTNIEGSLKVSDGFEVNGRRTEINTKYVHFRDQQLVIGTQVSDITDANRTGIVIGDSASPVAKAQIRTDNTVDSNAWVFDPGIEAPFIKVDEFSFDVIDCGKYA